MICGVTLRHSVAHETQERKALGTVGVRKDMSHQQWQKLLKFNCIGCGNCCRDTVVCLTDADVRRIVDGTGREAGSFVQFYDVDEVGLSKHSPFWVALGKQKAVMGLKWTHGHCLFLDTDNRCTIYEHRPVTCRQHPFDIQLSDTGVVTHLSLSRVVDCPHDWSGQLTRRGLRSLLSWNDRQTVSYFAKVRQWNSTLKQDQITTRFLEFLGFNY